MEIVKVRNPTEEPVIGDLGHDAETGYKLYRYSQGKDGLEWKHFYDVPFPFAVPHYGWPEGYTGASPVFMGFKKSLKAG